MRGLIFEIVDDRETALFGGDRPVVVDVAGVVEAGVV